MGRAALDSTGNYSCHHSARTSSKEETRHEKNQYLHAVEGAHRRREGGASPLGHLHGTECKGSEQNSEYDLINQPQSKAVKEERV